MCSNVPTIVITDGKASVYLDMEEWNALHLKNQQLLNYFAGKRSMLIPGSPLLRLNNICIHLTSRGKIRCMKIEHIYPWVTMLSPSNNPGIQPAPPQITLIKHEVIKFCDLFLHVKKTLDLLCEIKNKCTGYFGDTRPHCSPSDVLNLSLSNSFFNNCIDSLLLYRNDNNKK